MVDGVTADTFLSHGDIYNVLYYTPQSRVKEGEIIIIMMIMVDGKQHPCSKHPADDGSRCVVLDEEECVGLSHHNIMVSNKFSTPQRMLHVGDAWRTQLRSTNNTHRRRSNRIESNRIESINQSNESNRSIVDDVESIVERVVVYSICSCVILLLYRTSDRRTRHTNERGEKHKQQ
jgi:hypothetical protein